MTNKIFTPFPILKTDRLILRQLVNTDDNEIFALRSDENVNRYLGRQPSKSIEDAKSFIQTINENVKNNNSIYWAISLGDKLIGTICLFEFSDDIAKAEIGYELLPSYQGKGHIAALRNGGCAVSITNFRRYCILPRTKSG